MKGKRLLWPTVLLLASALLLAVVAAPSASADISKAGYQIGFTMGCENPSLCGSQDVGGFGALDCCG